VKGEGGENGKGLISPDSEARVAEAQQPEAEKKPKAGAGEESQGKGNKKGSPGVCPA